MKRHVVWLGVVVALAALVAAVAGLFWHGEGSSYPFTTLRGEVVQMYGRGLYRHDTLLKAPTLRGADAVTLFLVAPLLVTALWRGRRGELRWQLLLAGLLAYCTHNAISLGFGAAYNELFLVYLVYFGASLFALILACLSVDLDDLATRLSPRFPRRLAAAFLIVAGLSVLVWLTLVIEATVQGRAPHGVDSYTTETTFLLDLGVIAPTAFLAAVLLWRRHVAGPLLAALLLTLNALIGPVVIGQTVMQSLAGVELTTSELLRFVGPFCVTSLLAAVLLVTLLRSVGPARHCSPPS
jgi:hypothetical protein